MHPARRVCPVHNFRVTVSAASANGRAVEVWESQDALDRFFQGSAAQVLQQAAVAVQPQVWPVHNVMRA